MKKQHSLNIYGHSAVAAVMIVLLDMSWKLVFRRRANNRTEAFLLLLIGQEKHFLSISTCSHQKMPMATLAACQMFPPGTITGLRDSTEMWPDYDKNVRLSNLKFDSKISTSKLTEKSLFVLLLVKNIVIVYKKIRDKGMLNKCAQLVQSVIPNKKKRTPDILNCLPCSAVEVAGSLFPLQGD